MDLDEFPAEQEAADVETDVGTLRTDALEADTIYRVIDLEAEVVCYHVSERDSLSCLPLSETALDVDELSE